MAFSAALGSNTITNLDTFPVLRPTRGTGAAVGDGGFHNVRDYVAVSTTALATVGNALKVIRFPIEAYVQSVKIYSDGPLDTNSSPTLALDINVAFSDANTSAVGGAAGQGLVGDQVQDGTSSTYAGQVPTSALDGAVTPLATYSSPNILFGTYTVQSHTAGIPWITDVTFGGATGLANNDYTLAMLQEPMWYVLGFTNNNLAETTGGTIYGTPGPSIGGYFDFVAVASVAAATASTTHKFFMDVTYFTA
jgi:hypothetical protein